MVPGCSGTIGNPGDYSAIGYVAIKKHPTARDAQEAGRFLQGVVYMRHAAKSLALLEERGAMPANDMPVGFRHIMRGVTRGTSQNKDS